MFRNLFSLFAWLTVGVTTAGAMMIGAIAVAAAPAMAGSPVLAAATWTGFYVGADIGGAWSDSDWRYNANYFNTAGSTLLGSNFSFADGGVFGGGHLGYDFQQGPWVLGVEGSVDGADLKDSRPSPFYPATDVYTLKSDLLTSVTARAGIASGQWLFYAKGGWAGANVNLDLFDQGAIVRASDSRFVNGWTAGGGIAYALTRRISFSFEYDFAKLSTDNWTLPCPNCGTLTSMRAPTASGDINVQSAVVRLDYRFGG